MRLLSAIQLTAAGHLRPRKTGLFRDFSRMDDLSEEDREAIEAFGTVFTGSDRPMVVTDGASLLPPGEVFSEDGRPPVLPNFQARPNRRRLRSPSADCAPPLFGSRVQSTGRAKPMVSFPCSRRWPAIRACLLMSRTGKISGRRCIAWTPRASSA